MQVSASKISEEYNRSCAIFKRSIWLFVAFRFRRMVPHHKCPIEVDVLPLSLSHRNRRWSSGTEAYRRPSGSTFGPSRSQWLASDGGWRKSDSTYSTETSCLLLWDAQVGNAQRIDPDLQRWIEYARLFSAVCNFFMSKKNFHETFSEYFSNARKICTSTHHDVAEFGHIALLRYGHRVEEV